MTTFTMHHLLCWPTSSLIATENEMEAAVVMVAQRGEVQSDHLYMFTWAVTSPNYVITTWNLHLSKLGGRRCSEKATWMSQSRTWEQHPGHPKLWSAAQLVKVGNGLMYVHGQYSQPTEEVLSQCAWHRWFVNATGTCHSRAKIRVVSI